MSLDELKHQLEYIDYYTLCEPDSSRAFQYMENGERRYAATREGQPSIS